MKNALLCFFVCFILGGCSQKNYAVRESNFQDVYSLKADERFKNDIQKVFEEKEQTMNEKTIKEQLAERLFLNAL